MIQCLDGVGPGSRATDHAWRASRAIAMGGAALLWLSPPVSGQVPDVRVNLRSSRVYQDVGGLEQGFDPRFGLGAGVVVERVWRSVGLRVDYDRVGGFEMRLPDTAGSASDVHWLTGSLTWTPWCEAVCVGVEAGIGQGTYALNVTESPGTDVDPVRIFESESGRSTRWGVSLRTRRFPHLELSLARYVTAVRMRRPGRVSLETSMRSWLLGASVAISVRANDP